MIDLNEIKRNIKTKLGGVSKVLVEKIVDRTIAAESERDELKAKLAELEGQEPALKITNGHFAGWNPSYNGPYHGNFYAQAKPSAPAQRITEQDAREIADSVYAFRKKKERENFGSNNADWMYEEGRTLLAKLNEKREVEAVQEPLAYYYTRDRYTPQLRYVDDRIPEPDRSLWNEIPLGSLTANKVEVPKGWNIDIHQGYVRLSSLGEHGGAQWTVGFDLYSEIDIERAAALFLVDVSDSLPPLKDGE